MIPLFIRWDIDPVLIDFGFFSVRYYSLLFAFGIVGSGILAYRMLTQKGVSSETFMTLFYYVFFGIFLGARLGHCLFYEPGYYVTHPWEIILPFEITNGRFILTGYRGLASHGGVIGVLIALYLFSRKYAWNMLSLLDVLSIVAPFTAGCIRFGNLMNSEIVGTVTTVPWGFIFTNPDNYPRHPAQLYEACAYFLLFAINMYLYYKKGSKLQTGFFTGFILTYIFTYRFFIEFIKINQVDFEEDILLNMGQLLSIPYVLLGLYLLFFYRRKPMDKVS